ncbi:MAG: crossover junction endodeoxyribonuclease RuvC [Ignavibacteriae bacterium]|nr:crossover junction endodeoxyribonuclease RuvC [Ignavibacteriota bacterium]
MIVLGVDPGTLITGYGIIESRNGKVKVLSSDAIKNDSTKSMPLRLKLIYTRLAEVINKYHPDEFAIETAFYGKNAQSALKLGHARGVAMLAAVSHEIPTQEYSPREVKKAIVGNGNASKQQVQYMVKSLLKLKQVPKYYDTTDAIAVALCHLQRVIQPRRRFKDWKSFVTVHPEKLSSSHKSRKQ